MRVAFLTFDGEPDLAADDRAALGPLGERGIEVQPVVWDRRVTDLAGHDGFVFRSCWDYHRKPAAFLRLLAELEQLGTPAWNPPAVCAWNVDKRYLIELAGRGVRIPDSRLLPRGSRVSMDEVFPEARRDVVVKPAISLNGDDTYVFSADAAAEAVEAANTLASDRDVLVQAFIPEIRTTGELSLVFFGGTFSHAVRKLPAAGEFRVQVEHGGSRAVASPPASVVAEAARILAMAGPGLLYGRVDGVVTPEGFVLMELEVLDPTLFFGCDEAAPERFASALHGALVGTPSKKQ